MQLSTARRAMVYKCLVEGNSIRSTSRITGVAKSTILAFLVQAGEACADYQHEHVKDLGCQNVQLDEIWSFVGCKDKMVPKAKERHPGDVWTWTALCSDTKIVPAWFVGDRSGHSAYSLCHDKKPVLGNPDMDLCSTSYVERANLTMRMSMRRFTRKTNAFSKKFLNHCHMIAVHFMHYNFSRKHMTLKETPAKAAGIEDHRWSPEEVVEMIADYGRRKEEEVFDSAFADKFKTPRTTPKTYKPCEPKLPWYLDPESGGPPEFSH